MRTEISPMTESFYTTFSSNNNNRYLSLEKLQKSHAKDFMHKDPVLKF